MAIADSDCSRTGNRFGGEYVRGLGRGLRLPLPKEEQHIEG
jgi:hypothetical protein